MRRLIPAMILSMFISACGAVVKPDPSPINVIDANYPTVEMSACGKIWHGVGICRTKTTESLKVYIQGYFDGTLRVASPNCGIGKSISYSNSQRVSVTVPAGEGNCLLVVTMSPRFPNGDNGVEVSSMRGFLAVRRDDLPNQWVGRAVKLPVPATGNFKFPVGQITAGRTKIHGCGIDYDQPNNITNKTATVKFQEFVNTGGTTDECVADGTVFSDTYQSLLLSVMIVVYKTITPLPIPVTGISDGKLTVTASNAVSAIALDDDFRMGTSGYFDFDATKSHIVRALTAKGRTVIGIWSPGAGEFTWMQ